MTQRAALFDQLIASFDEQSGKGRAWVREITHREKQPQLGEAKLLHAAKVFADIRSKLQ